MVLPKIIYENLPYGYFITSGYLLTLEKSWLIYFSAALFYCAACIVLVTRSAYRRVDRTKPLKHRLPEIIYEYLPYSYAAVAIFILMATTSPILQFIALTLIVIALKNVILRHKNRKKVDPLFK